MATENLWTLLHIMHEDDSSGCLQDVDTYINRLPQSEASIREEYHLLVAASHLVDSPPSLGNVDHYHLLQQIGRGAQGAVFLAQDLRHQRKVALKILPPWTGTSRARRMERMRREGETLAKLSHPVLSRLLDTGEVDGTPYVVTEFVDGTPLCDLLTDTVHTGEKPKLVLPPRTQSQWRNLLRYISQCGHGLHSAHLAGIIHRDIKPGNLMVTNLGAPVVLDFGLAQDVARERSRLTQTGAAPGTPAYMAPELFQDAIPDRRSDLYSLAATLYHCASGQLPHQGENLAQGTHSTQQETPPSIRKYNPILPRELEIVLEVAMARDPNSRYSDARAFAEDLEAICERKPIQARALSFPLRLKRWVQRHPLVSTAGAAVAIVLGISYFQTQRLLEEKQRSLVQAERDKFLFASRLLQEKQPTAALELAKAALNFKKDSVSRSAVLSALVGLHSYPMMTPAAGFANPREVYSPLTEQVLFLRNPRELCLTTPSPTLENSPLSFQLPEDDWQGWREDELGGRLAISDDGLIAAIAPAKGEPLLIHTQSGKQIRVQSLSESSITCMSFNSDGSLLVTGDKNGTMRVSETSSGRLVDQISAHNGYLGAVFFWEEAGIIVSGSTGGHRIGIESDHRLKFWKLSSLKPRSLALQAEVELSGFLSSLCIDSRNSRLFVGDSGGLLLAFEAHSLPAPAWQYQLPNRIHAIAVSDSGEDIACGFGFNPDRESNTRSGAWVIPWGSEEGGELKLESSGATCSGIAFLPAAGQLATIDWNGHLKLHSHTGEVLWDCPQGKMVPKNLNWSSKLGCLVSLPRFNNPLLFYLPTGIVKGSSPKPLVPNLSPLVLDNSGEKTRPAVIASWIWEENQLLLFDDGSWLSNPTSKQPKTIALWPAELLIKASVSPDGSRLLTYSDHGNLRLLTHSLGEWQERNWSVSSSVKQVLPLWDTNRCLLYTADGELTLVDFNQDVVIPFLGAKLDAPLICWAQNEAQGLLAVGLEDGVIWILNLKEQSSISFHVTAGSHDTLTENWLCTPRALSFRPGHQEITIAIGPTIIQSWDYGTTPARLLLEIKPLVGMGESDQIAWSPKGETLLIANRSVRCLYLLSSDGEILDEYRVSSRAMFQRLDYWADGHAIASTREGLMFALRIHSDWIEPIATFSGHKTRIVNVDRSADGLYILSRSHDQMVLRWPLYPEKAFRDSALMATEPSPSALEGFLGSAGIRMSLPPSAWYSTER